jgi:hypothetical protein
MRRFTLRTVSLFQRKFFSNPKWRPPNFHRGRMLPFKIKEK